MWATVGDEVVTSLHQSCRSIKVSGCCSDGVHDSFIDFLLQRTPLDEKERAVILSLADLRTHILSTGIFTLSTLKTLDMVAYVVGYLGQGQTQG